MENSRIQALHEHSRVRDSGMNEIELKKKKKKGKEGEEKFLTLSEKNNRG